MPENLVVKLNREYYDFEDEREPIKKIKTKFNFANYMVWDMKSKKMGDPNNIKARDAMYELYAVTNHLRIVDGTGKETGKHYTALCNVEGSWFEFDDEKVRRIKDPVGYLNDNGDRPTLLYYKKIQPDRHCFV